MDNIELFINKPVNAKLDLQGDIPIALQYSVADIRDISKRNAAYSKTIVLPGTKNNNFWFGNLFDINSDFTSFNPNKKTSAKLLVNGELVIDGFLQLRKINKDLVSDDEGELIKYECVIYNNFVDLMTELGEKTIFELALDEFNHTFTPATVEASWSHEWEDGYVYPMVGTHEKDYQYNLDYFFPSAFYKMVFNKIIDNAGFGWTGSFANNEQFEKEIILYVKDGNVFIDETERNRRKFRAGITQSQTVPYGRTPVSFAANFPIIPTGGTNTIAGNKAVYRFDDDFTPPNFDNGPDVFNPSTWQWNVDRTGTYDLTVGVDYDISFFNDKTLTMTPPSGSGDVIIRPQHFIEKSINGGSTWTTLGSFNGANLNFGLSIAAGATVSRNAVATAFLQEVNLNQGDKVRITIKPLQNTIASFFTNDPPGSVSQGPLIRITYKGTPANFLFNDAYTAEIVQGDTIQLGAFLPDKIKQKDIISDLIKRYNLYIEVDPDNERLLVINERPNFYDNTPNVDWTFKKDHSKMEDIQLLSELQFKEMLFTWTEDNDLYNTEYRDITGDIYGQYKYIFDNDFVKGVKEIKSPFSPTPLVKTQFGAYVSAIDPTNPKVKPRILYWGGLKDYSSNWQLNYADFGSGLTVSSTFSQYPYAGHWDDPINPTLDIHFGTPKFLYYNEWEQIPVNSMYNVYWSDYIRQIEDGRLLTAYFNLDETDIRFIKDNFNTRVFVKDSYYYVNKIIDYKPLTPQTTKVELIKISDGIRWDGNGNAISEPITTSLCPVDMVAKLMRDTYYYVSASGATVSQDCCESIGGIWDSKNNSCRVKDRMPRPVGVDLLKPVEINGSGNGNGGGIYVGNRNNFTKLSTTDEFGFTKENRTFIYGDYNEVGTDNVAILGGDENIIDSTNSLIAMGNNNEVIGDHNFILGGDDNVIDGGNNTLMNSYGSTVSGSNITIIGSNGIEATQSNIIYLGNALTVDTTEGTIFVNGVTFSPGGDTLVYQSGEVISGSFSGTPLTYDVTFVGTFTASYVVSVESEDPRDWTVSNKTSTGFRLNSNSTTALTNNVYWTAVVGAFNSGDFVRGVGTTNTVPKFINSTNIGDSVISETGGFVKINSTGNQITPALTLVDTDTGFYRTATGSLSLACEGAEVMVWQDGLIYTNGSDLEVNGSLEVNGIIDCDLRIKTLGLSVKVIAKTQSNYSVSNSDYHVTVTNGSTNVILYLPSTAGGNHLTPANGQLISVTKIGSSSGNVRLTTGLSGGMLNPGTTSAADTFRIEGDEPNTTVQMIYDENQNKWITLSVMPSGNGFYDITL